MVDPVLERTLEMRERLRRAAESHALADVIPALFTQVACLTRQANLERYAVADFECADFRTDGCDLAGGLVAQCHRFFYQDVAISVVVEVV